jgi:hypothetical protein
MHTPEAIRILKKRLSYIHSIEPIGKNLYKVKYAAWFVDDEDMTSRQLIKWAKVHTADSKQNTAIKSNIKHYDHHKNRTATRDAIKTENFDIIPQGNKVVAENPWNWD